MKKIVFLVDTKDCNYLIINNKNKWELPSLNIKDDNEDEFFLCKKYEKKYNHSIRDIIVIEKNEKYAFIKCKTDTKPIKVIKNLPAITKLAQENIFVMDTERAENQQIRPLHILLVNLMPTKERIL